MTAIVYWRGRLRAGEPLHHPETRAVGADLRFDAGNGPNGWPRALSKQALYEDYLWWFEGVYLYLYRESPYFVDNPDKMPKPMDRLSFFSCMQPLVNPRDTPSRTYNVRVKQHFEGRYLDVKVSRAFYRLAPLAETRLAFVKQTGMRLVADTDYLDVREVALLADELKRLNN